MSEESNRTNCQQCGNSIQVGDKFCGSCGAVVSNATPEDAQVIPRPAAAQATPARNFRRTLLLAGGIGVLLLLIGGGAMALLGSGGEEVEIAPDVYSEVPERWAVATLSENGQGVELVLEGYENQKIEDFGSSTETQEASDKVATISAYESSCTEASGLASPGKQSFQTPEITSGYDENTNVSESVAKGEATVAGNPATWDLSYSASITPWRLPNSDSLSMSEYPTYIKLITLSVCVEDLDLSASMLWSNTLNETRNREPEDEPTSERNGLVPESREEVYAEIQPRYEANIEALIELLEEADIEGLFTGGSTDLSEIPTNLDSIDEGLSDPFDGELAEGSSVPDEPEVPEDDEPSQVSETTSSTTTSERDEYEEFAREYDEASRDEDWEATYSMLYETSQAGVTDSQDEFTEEEWIEIHEALRDENGEPAPLDFVTIDQNDEATDSPARVTLYYEDDTQETITVIIPMAVASDDESGPQRFLTEEEIEELNDVSTSESTESELTAPLGDNFLADAEEAAEEYYQAAGLENWEYTYEHLDSETQNLFTEEEWIKKNQYYWDQSETIYNIISVEQLPDPEEIITEVEVRITGEDGSSFDRTTYWVLEGEWLHRFSQEEIDLFMPELSFEEFVEANQ